ncbi:MULTISPECIES: DUF6766 family protein [Streptomyces]|uniref:DUF6766 family protein n=1 Tax=Streptomyces flaveolus TaxID=67297 RepID=A0ABV3A8U1_9ACTN
MGCGAASRGGGGAGSRWPAGVAPSPWRLPCRAGGARSSALSASAAAPPSASGRRPRHGPPCASRRASGGPTAPAAALRSPRRPGRRSSSPPSPPAPATIFAWSWLAQSVTGVAAYNEEHLRQLQAPISWSAYLGSADFWDRTLQNCSRNCWPSPRWPSSPSICASVRSPESKPVGAAHTATGVEG